MKILERSMKSSRLSLDLSVRFTRRTATVTISAPEAAWHRAISWKLRYFPVPTMRRDQNSRPAIIRLSGMSLFYSRLFERAAEGVEIGGAIESIDAFVTLQEIHDGVRNRGRQYLINDLEQISPEDQLCD